MNRISFGDAVGVVGAGRWVIVPVVVMLLLGGCVHKYAGRSSPVEKQVDVSTPVPVELSDSDNGSGSSRFLSDPFLQLPTSDSVRVVWFTDFEGSEHSLTYVQTDGDSMTVEATTAKMTRMYEDGDSWLRDVEYDTLTERDVWRHEAEAKGLTAGVRLPYWVTSVTDTNKELVSDEFTFQPLPEPGSEMRILLTSDQQNRQMSAANFQKVEETVGKVDAIFYAGDMVDYPHRASEWFDRFDAAWLDGPGEKGEPPYPQARPAFFPAMQGNYQEVFPEFPYSGGALLQHAPLFGTIGNHEAPGRWRPDSYTINEMDNDPQPRWYAQMRYAEQKDEINPTGDAEVRENWIRDHSYEFTSYFEVWTHPDDGPQGEAYYAYQIGDVFLISMNVSRVWRDWEVADCSRGKFRERLDALNNPDEWGFGDMWFERFDEGSEQYEWLVDVLESEAFANAKYRVVMAHQSVFGLGDNVVPALADPVVTIVYDDGRGESSLTLSWPVDGETWQDEIEPVLNAITEVRYEYLIEDDVWFNDIEPLLLEYGVDLVLSGNSHVWNRAEVDGMHYLETSNVGNTFGAHYADEVGTVSERASWATSFWDELSSDESRWDEQNYPKTGDVHGREPVFPTEFNPMDELEPLAEDNRPLPFVSSNNLTVFSILDTGDGSVSSYVFDTRDLESDVRLFDRFVIGKR